MSALVVSFDVVTRPCPECEKLLKSAIRAIETRSLFSTDMFIRLGTHCEKAHEQCAKISSRTFEKYVETTSVGTEKVTI